MESNLFIYCIKYQNWDEIFIYNEIQYFSPYFNNIEIIPLLNSTENIQKKLPKNVSLNLNLSQYLEKNLAHISLYERVTSIINWKFFKLCFKINPLKIKSLFFYFIKINAIKIWCEINLRNNTNTVHYTYWFTETTSALCLSKKIQENCKIISRAHRFDLYNEFGSEISNLFKKENLKSITKVYAISDHGLNYLKLTFPDYKSKLTISKLGTIDPGFISPLKETNSIQLFSCSLIVKTKRIDLIVESLKILSDQFPEIKIQWIHAGTGILEDEIKSLSMKLLKGKIKYKFLGFVPNNEIYRIYKKSKIDILLNVSESEGIPVTFMEAQSCGVPVIATSVGGTPEIINNMNGLLLSTNPKPDEIAAAIYDVYINKEKWNKKREFSRRNWEDYFNADRNYSKFAKEVVSLIKI